MYPLSVTLVSNIHGLYLRYTYMYKLKQLAHARTRTHTVRMMTSLSTCTVYVEIFAGIVFRKTEKAGSAKFSWFSISLMLCVPCTQTFSDEIFAFFFFFRKCGLTH